MKEQLEIAMIAKMNNEQCLVHFLEVYEMLSV